MNRAYLADSDDGHQQVRGSSSDGPALGRTRCPPEPTGRGFAEMSLPDRSDPRPPAAETSGVNRPDPALGTCRGVPGPRRGNGRRRGVQGGEPPRRQCLPRPGHLGRHAALLREVLCPVHGSCDVLRPRGHLPSVFCDVFAPSWGLHALRRSTHVSSGFL